MNPHTQSGSPKVAQGNATDLSARKIHRETLTLAPALAERLAKERWRVRTDKPEKQDPDTDPNQL